MKDITKDIDNILQQIESLKKELKPKEPKTIEEKLDFLIERVKALESIVNARTYIPYIPPYTIPYIPWTNPFWYVTSSQTNYNRTWENTKFTNIGVTNKSDLNCLVSDGYQSTVGEYIPSFQSTIADYTNIAPFVCTHVV